MVRVTGVKIYRREREGDSAKINEEVKNEQETRVKVNDVVDDVGVDGSYFIWWLQYKA